MVHHNCECGIAQGACVYHRLLQLVSGWHDVIIGWNPRRKKCGGFQLALQIRETSWFTNTFRWSEHHLYVFRFGLWIIVGSTFYFGLEIMGSSSGLSSTLDLTILSGLHSTLYLGSSSGLHSTLVLRSWDLRQVYLLTMNADYTCIECFFFGLGIVFRLTFYFELGRRANLTFIRLSNRLLVSSRHAYLKQEY